MSENRGIFSLEEFYDLQVSGEITNIFDPFRFVNSLPSTVSNYGYWAGGYVSGSPGVTSNVQRMDFDSDTTSALTKGPLDSESASVNNFTGNQTHGHYAGGNYNTSPYYWSTQRRIDYSNDTAAVEIKGSLNFPTGGVAATGNLDKGYWWGGRYNPNPLNYLTYVDRIDYSNSTVTAMPPSTTQGNGRAATGNLSYGWWSGAQQTAVSPYIQSWIYRLDYSNDTAAASERGSMTRSVYDHSAAGNSNYGWHVAGQSPSASSYVDRIDYSNDTSTASPKGNLGYNSYAGGGTGNQDYGYFVQAPGNTCVVQRIDYANDTAQSSPKGNILAEGHSFRSATSPRINGFGSSTPIAPATRTENYPAGFPFGYTSGGIDDSPATISSVERIDFSSSTLTPLLKGPLPVAKYSHAGTGNLTHGYHGGGYTSGNSSTVDRIDYANDSPTASPKGNLAFAGSSSTNAAVGNVSYGYWNEGQASPSTRVSRVDFSNDSAVASPKGNLVTGGLRSSATGTQSYGYFCNSVSTTSNPSPTTSTSERIDYSNDTATALQRANSSFDQYGRAAAGNSSYGYWFGGTPHDFSEPWTTNVDRLDYSSDTTTMSPKGNLYTIATRNAATSDANHGYIMGRGMSPATNIQQYDFGNDTSTALNKAQMNQNRGYNAASASHANANPSTTANTIDKGADGYIAQSTSGNSTYPYGYIAGGYSTEVDRIDYDNDTATAAPKGPLTQSRYNYNQSVATPSKGYVIGGYSPTVPEPNGNLSSIDRIDLSNDTATAPSVANLNFTPGLYGGGAVGNNDYGYLGGGGKHPGGSYSTVRRFDYSSDTSNTVDKSTLHGAKMFHTAVGNLSYGYFGGYSGDSQIDRLDYSNDTAATTPKGNTVTTRRLRASTGNQSYGYLSGGQTDDAPSYAASTIERIDYSNDTANVSPKGPMAGNRYLHAATGSGRYGYQVGGRIGDSPGSTSDRLDFANDTDATSPKGNMTRATRSWSGLSSQEDGKQSFTNALIPRIRWVNSAAEAPASGTNPLGYLGGGRDGGTPLSTVDKIDYSNDTATASVAGSLTDGKRGVGAAGNNFFAYFAGGNSPSAGSVSSIDRLDYSSDSTNTLSKGNLSFSNYGLDGVGNANFGYFASSDYPLLSTVNRVDYSNDTATAAVKGPLSNPVDYAGAAGNQSFGYFAGGGSPVRSTIDRIDYSNDTPTASPKGPLQAVKRSFAATGNASFGYWGGGYSGPSQTTTIDRLDYSNDTSTSLKGPLSIQRVHHSAVGNASFGYFAGGETPSESSTVDRLDYSSDTSTATPKGNISVGRVQFKGASAQEENGLTATPAIAAPVQPPFPYPVQLPSPPAPGGYMMGGYANYPTPSGPRSFVERIDFAIDGGVASPKGNLTDGAYSAAATGNLSYGWVKLGRTPSVIKTSLLNRIDFSNDTATASSRTPLSSSSYQTSAVGNVDYGYYCGGADDSNPRISTVNRLDFSNDSTSPATKGPLSQVKDKTSSAGTQSYGYIAGGSTGGPPWIHNLSVVDRIDYSSDTSTASPKGPLVVGRYGMAATSNTSYGWWSGGRAYPGGNKTSTDRLDFSSDTTTMTPKGPLTSVRYSCGSFGNSSYGFAGAGGSNQPNSISSVDRIDYSNDTATAPLKGYLNTIRKVLDGVSATDNANPQ